MPKRDLLDRASDESNSRPKSDSALNLLTEDLVSLAEAAREIPPKPRHVATIWRWRTRGIRGVKLETVQIGQRSFTSRQALTRFLRATQDQVE